MLQPDFPEQGAGQLDLAAAHETINPGDFPGAQLERNNETMRKELTAVRDLIRTQAEKLKLLKRRSLRNSNR